MRSNASPGVGVSHDLTGGTLQPTGLIPESRSLDPWLTELIEAAIAGHQRQIGELLEREPQRLNALLAEDMSELTPGSTLLHLAVHVGSIELQQELIRSGVHLETRNAAGRTALHDSIEIGFEEGTCLLIESGAVIDVCSASILGLVDELCDLLSRAPELANDQTTGLSPLGWAAFGNQPEAARILLERGARMDDGELLCAASAGHVQVGRVLLDHGADPNAFDTRAGGTALHSAVGMKFTADSTEFIKLLLSSGADPTIQTTSGLTAPELAQFLAERQEQQKKKQDAHGFERAYDRAATLLRDRIYFI